MLSSVRVFDLSPKHALALWPRIVAHLGPLLEKEGLYEPADILIDHIRGDKKIWVAWRDETKEAAAALVTEIRPYPLRRVCAVVYCAGTDMDSWLDQFVTLSEAYARGMGCSRMAIYGREGWVRAAGYEKIGCILRKEL